MPQIEALSGESIYLELLQALAARPKRAAAQAPELAKALGTSAQFVVARLQPLVKAGFVSRHSTASVRVYAISDEGREYLIRQRPSQNRGR